MKNTIVIALSFFTFVVSTHAQQLDSLRLVEYMNALGENNKFMGSVALMQDSKVLFAKSVGFADVENGKHADLKTKFRIGSISKTFTATMILKAVEEGKLRLDDKLSSYYPKVVNADRITIEQMLYHRTGIHSFTEEEEYMSWNTKFHSNEELLEMINNFKSDFEPDSKFEYSNSNFVLLSFILQDIYSKSYADLLKEKITAPLHLKNTYYGGTIKPENNECNSYAFVGTWDKVSETDMSIPIGAGAIVSNVFDLLIFIEALLNEKIISQESIAKMTSYKDGFGLGVFDIPVLNIRGVGHTGGIDGFTSLLVYFPENKMAFALTSNGTNYRNNSIANTIIGNALGEEVVIPKFTTYQVDEKELEKYLGYYKTDALPLDISISKKGNILFAQATGQSELALDATAKDEFSYELVGIVIQFYPSEDKLILKQRGAEYTFTRDNK